MARSCRSGNFSLTLSLNYGIKFLWYQGVAGAFASVQMRNLFRQYGTKSPEYVVSSETFTTAFFAVVKVFFSVCAPCRIDPAS